MSDVPVVVDDVGDKWVKIFTLCQPWRVAPLRILDATKSKATGCLITRTRKGIVACED